MNCVEKIFPLAMLSWCNKKQIPEIDMYSQMQLVISSFGELDMRRLKVAIKLSKSRLHGKVVRGVVADAVSCVNGLYEPVKNLLARSLFVYGDISLFKFATQSVKSRLNIRNVTIKTAEEIDESYKSKLREEIISSFGQKVSLKYETDPALISGSIVTVGSRKVDSSMLGRLNYIVKKLEEDLR